MKTPTKDLFDDSTMTFGEHLEALRVHLVRALLGLVLSSAICLYQGGAIVDFIRQPIDRALRNYSNSLVTDDTAAMKAGAKSFWQNLGAYFGLADAQEMITGPSQEQIEADARKAAHPETIVVSVDARELAAALRQALPGEFPAEAPTVPPPAETPPLAETPITDAPLQPQKADPAPQLTLTLKAAEFRQFQAVVEQSQRAVTLKVEEAFMTYMKVSLIAAVVLASPWIFYQIWQFVAAGLYPHEQKYVYVFGSMSLMLFLTGAAFCFYAVFPFVLKFLLEFNKYLGIAPQIRLSEWISFAMILPLMFGISFQLPLVMLFLERINIFQVEHYTQQRRMSILVIAILSAVLTPADPMSMLLMMFPLIFLYELGIMLCRWLPTPSPFEGAEA